MTLFPQLDLNYYPYRHNDIELQERMNKAYTEGITINQSFWSEADIDARFRAGDQTLWNDIYGNLPAFRRRQFNFNRIRRICNMISGYQRRNRKSIVVTPLENSDAQTASQFTKLMFWAIKNCNFLETFSEAFDGCITTGMNLLSFWMDYRADPINGEPRVDNIPYNQFLIDPFFRKHDLSDCNYVWIRRYLTKEQVLSLLPEHKEEIEKIYTGGYRDGKFQFMPESYAYGQQNLMVYDEYYYRSFRPQTLLVDLQTGETIEWKGDTKNLSEFKKQYRQVESLTQDIPTVKLGIVVQGHTFYHGANPLGIDRYPFVPVFGYYDPQIPYYPWRIQGVVRGLRDAQYLYNRRKVIELDILESTINSGWKYKENSLVNPRDIFFTGQGRGLALKQEAQMTDAEQIQPPQVPPSMIQLSQILGQEIQEISGVNEELLGSAVDDKAGILSMLRQGAGLTTLQILFDQADTSLLLAGKIFLELFQANFSPGKVRRIIDQEPTAQFYHRAFGKYDAALEEGLNTTTQRQLQFAQLLQLRELGIPVPAEILVETSTLSDKQQLIEKLQQEQQQQQMQQQQTAELQQQLLAAQVQNLQAKATADEGLGIERLSRVQENRALAIERLAESKKDQDLGALHMAKTLKELQSLDLEHLRKLIEMAEYLKTLSNQDRAEAIEAAEAYPKNDLEKLLAKRGEPPLQEVVEKEVREEL